ncbi:hypothetical protein Syun_015944 [Stephania yunnanensis]|uniref:Uncharacterized protein n=1 Tax=Stephania yunnanensis TaxID=152371 RepID=A0AAP0P0W8_9MAGN
MEQKKGGAAELGSPPCRSNDQEHGSELQEKRAPVKRSLKIGDKITALQKLVSPFGKGDPRSNEGLRRRGLCLVPVSFTQNLANKDHTDEFV